MNRNKKYHRVILAILGGGVSGAAAAYVARQCTNIESIGLFERYASWGKENSHPLNNAQTSHDGGTETNYDLAHALPVQRAARMLRNFVRANGVRGELYQVTKRMVLGVGAEECELLRRRYEAFRSHYPDLSLREGRHAVGAVEPALIRERDRGEDVSLLVSDQGYAINYGKLAEEMVYGAMKSEQSFFHLEGLVIRSIVRESNPADDCNFTLIAESDIIRARAIIVAAGAYSLIFAQDLGYGRQFGILPVAGSFYTTKPVLTGKVYTVQKPGIPFAAVHGDPDITDPTVTRFGPTAKPLPLLTRHNWGSFFKLARTPTFSWEGMLSALKILRDPEIRRFVLRSSTLDLPWIGPRRFIHDVRKIVPSLRVEDLKLRRGAGGIRPQLYDIHSGELTHGEALIEGNDEEGCALFLTTPSPGASVCFQNAENMVRKVARHLDLRFHEERFLDLFGLEENDILAAA